MPTFTIFAGINGAGKSTLYDHLRSLGDADLGMRICPDEILQDFNGDWKSNRDIFKSGHIAIDKINFCIENGISFNWETTLVGHIGKRFIAEAKIKGFNVHLNFIGVDNVEQSLERIKYRVASGGHGVPEKLVRFRHERQSSTLVELLPTVDQSLLYNNSDTIEIVASYYDDTLHVYNYGISWLQQVEESLNTPNTDDIPDNIE